MNAEAAASSARLRSLLTHTASLVDGLSDDQLGWTPPAEGANGAGVIAAHVQGNMRAFVLGIACGRDVQRDRPAEFAAVASAAELIAGAHALAAEIDAAMAALTGAELDRRLTPPQSLWGEGTVRELSVREALAHAEEHAAIHLGHLQLTRDLALSGWS